MYIWREIHALRQGILNKSNRKQQVKTGKEKEREIERLNENWQTIGRVCNWVTFSNV